MAGLLVLGSRTTGFPFPSDHAVMAGAVTAGLFLVARRLGRCAPRRGLTPRTLARPPSPGNNARLTSLLPRPMIHGSSYSMIWYPSVLKAATVGPGRLAAGEESI